MNKLPCKDCICLPICLSKYKEYRIVSKDHGAVSFLMFDCILLEHYLYPGAPTMEINLIKEKRRHLRFFQFINKFYKRK